MKWITISQYIDLETGEILPKETVDKHYTIIKLVKQNDHAKYNTSYRRITYECRRKPEQLKLF